MMVVDTSALMAILMHEPKAADCKDALSTNEPLHISAATLAEALIVSERRGVKEKMSELVESLGLVIEEVTPATALRVADAHANRGVGRHRAALNFGDCFSYELAKRHECPLLCIGNEFSRTDLSTIPAETSLAHPSSAPAPF